jgi:hypothetical protein
MGSGHRFETGTQKAEFSGQGRCEGTIHGPEDFTWERVSAIRDEQAHLRDGESTWWTVLMCAFINKEKRASLNSLANLSADNRMNEDQLESNESLPEQEMMGALEKFRKAKRQLTAKDAWVVGCRLPHRRDTTNTQLGRHCIHSSHPQVSKSI